MANNVVKVNGIAIANIAKLNGITDANLVKLNGEEFTGGFGGITWSTDDTLPASFGHGIKMGLAGAVGINASTKATYEHDGSSWSTTGSSSAEHTVGGGGGTQSAGVAFGGATAAGDTVTTEEYNGSSWSTGNNMVGGLAYGVGSGTLQTACLATGGSNYNPTVRNIPLTQTYNGTNWANESVNSSGQGAGSAGESGGGGLDAWLNASGAFDAGATSACQVFDQSAGTWTSKATVSTIARYTGSSTDGTRVYKIGGYNAPAFTQTAVVESWVENTWTTENSMPAAKRANGVGGGVEEEGGASSIGGADAGGATNSYFIAAAS